MAGETEPRPAPSWSYEQAFARNLGLITHDEQQRLRGSHVALAGLGGVGGAHLMTLTRLGIGRFTLADPDQFEVANFNRQQGANLSSIGHNKAEVLAQQARAVNPELQLRVFPQAITVDNVADFLEGASVVLDGIDFFSLDARRLVFQQARQRGLWAVTAGPLGFSTAWLAFSPTGMSFDEYFDIDDATSPLDGLVAFAMGLAPGATHLKYLDLHNVDVSAARGPSLSLACQLASGVAATEVVKILLGRPGVRPAPYYFQFDAYRHVLRRGCLRMGNRHPLQRLKRAWLRRRLQRSPMAD